MSGVQLDRAVQTADGHSRYGDHIDKASQYTIRILNDALKKANGGPIDTFPIFFQSSMVLALMVVCGVTVEEASPTLKDLPFPMKRLGE